MPKAYMISNRNRQGDQLGARVVENPRYFISDAAPNARNTLQNWKQISQSRFVQMILSETTKFPEVATVWAFWFSSTGLLTIA